MTYLTTVLEITNVITEYVGVSDVEEFFEKLRIFGE